MLASARDLPVFMANEVAPRPGRVLATLRMETADLPNLTTSAVDELAVWKDELRKTAFRLGADAVTGVYEVRRTDSAHITVCALAVAYRDSADGADTCGCVVALPLPRLRLGIPEGDPGGREGPPGRREGPPGSGSSGARAERVLRVPDV